MIPWLIAGTCLGYALAATLASTGERTAADDGEPARGMLIGSSIVVGVIALTWAVLS